MLNVVRDFSHTNSQCSFLVTKQWSSRFVLSLCVCPGDAGHQSLLHNEGHSGRDKVTTSPLRRHTSTGAGLSASPHSECEAQGELAALLTATNVSLHPPSLPPLSPGNAVWCANDSGFCVWICRRGNVCGHSPQPIIGTFLPRRHLTFGVFCGLPVCFLYIYVGSSKTCCKTFNTCARDAEVRVE